MEHSELPSTDFEIHPDGCSKDFFPAGFVPRSFDVIIGRGKKCQEHPGNVLLRKIVNAKLPEYSIAKSKSSKSTILSDVIGQLRTDSPAAVFVKLDPSTGKWYNVGDFLAREKISQSFRDTLHKKYKSSNANKKKRRLQEKAKEIIGKRNIRDQLMEKHNEAKFKPSVNESYDMVTGLAPTFAECTSDCGNPFEPTPLMESNVHSNSLPNDKMGLEELDVTGLANVAAISEQFSNHIRALARTA